MTKRAKSEKKTLDSRNVGEQSDATVRIARSMKRMPSHGDESGIPSEREDVSLSVPCSRTQTGRIINENISPAGSTKNEHLSGSRFSVSYDSLSSPPLSTEVPVLPPGHQKARGMLG